MRVKITYEYDKSTNTNFPFWAKSVLNLNPVCTCGESWEAARKDHLAKLSAIAHAPEPPIDEEIDL